MPWIKGPNVSPSHRPTPSSPPDQIRAETAKVQIGHSGHSVLWARRGPWQEQKEKGEEVGGKAGPSLFAQEQLCFIPWLLKPKHTKSYWTDRLWSRRPLIGLLVRGWQVNQVLTIFTIKGWLSTRSLEKGGDWTQSLLGNHSGSACQSRGKQSTISTR